MRLVLILIAFMMKLFVLCASAVVPRTRKGFYKFWWDEELSLLKEAAVHANNIWRATGKPKQGQIFINRQQTRLQYRRKIR